LPRMALTLAAEGRERGSIIYKHHPEALSPPYLSTLYDAQSTILLMSDANSRDGHAHLLLGRRRSSFCRHLALALGEESALGGAAVFAAFLREAAMAANARSALDAGDGGGEEEGEEEGARAGTGGGKALAERRWWRWRWALSRSSSFGSPSAASSQGSWARAAKVNVRARPRPSCLDLDVAPYGSGTKGRFVSSLFCSLHRTRAPFFSLCFSPFSAVKSPLFHASLPSPLPLQRRHRRRPRLPRKLRRRRRRRDHSSSVLRLELQCPRAQ